MSLSPTLRIPFQRKRQRWPFILAFVVVLIIIGWQVAERMIDADRYRPYLVERITKNTGLPATVERMDLVLLPVPALRATNISVGEGDFKATCTHLSAYPRVSSLMRGAIDIQELKIDGLAATLPTKPGDLKTRFDAMISARAEHAASGDQGGSGVQLEIGRIHAPDATIALEGVEKPVFSGDLAATNVLSDTISIIADAVSPAYGDGTALAGAITLERDSPEEIGLGVHGDLTLTNLDTSTLFSAERVPPAVATVKATIERTGASRVKIALDGNAVPVPMDGVDLAAIAGAFTGVAWWDSGQITVNDLVWNAPGLQFTSDITIEPDGGVATRVKEVNVDRAGLQAFLSAQSSANYRVVATEDARISAKDLLIGLTADKKLRLVSGTGTFTGVDLTLPKGQRAIEGFSGELAFENDTLRIVSLKADDLGLQGSVKPNIGEGNATVELKGSAKLTRERLAMVMPLDTLKQATANIALDRVTGTFSSAGGVPPDLSISGKLSGGTFEIDSPSWADRFASVEATFKATPGSIETSATSTTQKLGNVSVNGTYAIEARTWKGNVRGNLAKMDLPFLKQEAAKEVAPGILAAYGDSNFEVALDLPHEKNSKLRVAFVRAGSPELDGEVVMLSEKSGWNLGDVIVNAALPGATFQPILPETLRVDGLVPIRFARNAEKGIFDATVDLDDNTIAISDYLTKKSGTTSAMNITGVATTGNWAAKSVAITCLDQTVNGVFTDARFEIPQFEINAGALAALMPAGTRAGGRIRGNFATQPVKATVALDQVNFALNEQLGIDLLNGGLTYNDGVFGTEDLAVRGANSDFTIDLVTREEGWSGALTGKQLDVNAMLAMKSALESHSASVTTAAEPASQQSTGFTGTFDVNMGTVLIKKGVLENVFTNVKAVNGDMEIGNLTFANRGGTGSGWVRLMQARNDRNASTAMSLKVEGIDQALIDDLTFEEPRGLKGPMTGTIDLEIFSGENLPLLSGTNGAVKLSSTDGTFGKLGIATKVLSVLRTLEITRLRAPKLKDQGLAYDTCDMEATFNNGVMTLHALEMKTPSYVITALGGIDFNAQQTEILVHVDLMETVLGPADSIPGLGDVIGSFRKTGGLRILLTGSPVDPNTSYGFGPRTNAITQEVKETVKGSGNIVRDQIINRATEALQGILNKN